ncbi:alpha/beta hydrolase [Geodermatophilus sp. SYSU D00703]
MPLHSQTAGLLAAMEAQGALASAELSVSQAREVAGTFKDLQGPLVQVASVRDRTVPGPAGALPIRIYTPNGSPRDVLVYFHGGGWVIGNIEIADAPCRALADAAGCVVVSAQYRLAPESAYPAAPEDCYAVTQWVAEHQSELVDRDHHLVDEAQAKEPYASPALADDHSGLPPAFIAVAEFDPLRDDGVRYAELLEEAGVPATLERYDGQIHGIFWLCEACSEGFQPLLADLSKAVRDALQ